MSDAQLMTLFVEPPQDHESPPAPAILSPSFSSSDPFDGIEWETRESILSDDTGKDTLSKGMVTVPCSFSTNASDVLCSKYLRRRGVPTDVQPLSMDPFSSSYPKEGSSFGGETDLRQAIHRMAGCWAHWGIRSGLLSPAEASTLYLDASFLLARQCWAPNSPQWFNTGLFWAYGISGPSSGHFFVDETGFVREATRSYERPQPHACFIQSVGDDLVGDGGIMDLWVREARLFKFGSGTGTNFSQIRAKGEFLSGGGQSSGLMSWLKIGDRSAAGIQSGGTTRRAAKMVILDVDHPEIESFVTWKAKEEQKVAALVTGSRANRRISDQIWSSIQAFQSSAPLDRFDPAVNRELKKALVEGRKLGVPDKVMARAIEFAREGKKFDPQTFDLDWRGEAYDSVSGQQSNNSVSIPHSFMEKVFSNQNWSLVSRTTGSVVKHLSASGLYDQICESAWVCADPGVQFVDTMNEWNTVAEDGRIKATNPCIPGFSTMLTPDGIRPFSSLEEGAVVWTGKRWTRLIKKWSTGIKEVFEFHTRAGMFIGTEDHRVVSDGTKVEVKDAEVIDLALGSVEWSPLEGFEQDIVDGLCIGDGSIKISNHGSDIYRLLYVGKADLDYFSSEVARFVAANPFDRTAHLVETTLSIDELPKTFLRRIPDRFLFGCREKVRAFLRGLYSANGSVVANRVTLKASSFQIISDVQKMLSSLGIRSYYTTNPPHDVEFDNGVYACKESYDLNVTVDRCLFRELIGFIQKYKQDKLDAACLTLPGSKPPKMSYEVVSKVSMGMHEVFDFTVSDEEHVVWNNGLLVSNCSEYVFLDDTACNLASLNLTKFWTPDGGFDLKAFESAVRLVTTILEISVSMASLPSEAIAKGTWLYRTLGLGYANLGALLMQMGVPYDSEEGRRIGAAITSFMTAVAYDQSGIMASKVGPFPRWAENKDHMTRVLENHRRASLGLPLDRVTHCSPPLDNSVSDRASRILNAASLMWSSALSHAETHGYRNAQVTCIAPTGTIAIEMDCDTTGIEPDFALVKHKTLAGGGFMKIVNRSVPQALSSLGYDDGQIDSICTWILGSGSFSQKMVKVLYDKLPIDTVLMLCDRVSVCNNIWAVLLPEVIGRTVLSKAGIDPDDVAGGLGLTDSFLREENLYVFGRQTLEGCPILSPEHLPVFDCAGRCGIGTRSIRPEGHLLMLAAVQPFLSGAASKTVNLPSSATSRDVREVYSWAWKLGVKCVALYVDGSKFSQPLSSGVAEKMFGSIQDLDLSPDSPDHAKVVQQIVEKVSIKYISERRKLPSKRRGYTQKVMIGNHKFFLRTGEYPDGSLGEIFVDTHKDGTAFKSLMGAFAIAVSVGLQHGVPLERFVDLFTFVKFEPNGPVAGDDRLMMCTSLLDWIFRHLAVNYLDRDDLATVPKDDSAFDPKTIGEGESNIDIDKSILDGSESGGCLSTEELVLASSSPRGDSVSFSGEYCDACGQFSLVRKGRCSSCSNPACRAETGGCG